VRLHVYVYIQITGGTAVGPCIAHASQDNPASCIDSGRNGHLDFLLLALQAGAMAGGTGVVDHLAAAVARGTRTGNGKEAAVAPYLTAAVAGRTSLRPAASL